MRIKTRAFVLFLSTLLPCVFADSAPSPDIYYRRLGHSIVAVGDYLYLHGGQISWDSGNGTAVGQDAQDSNRVNITLAVPLAESWNNNTVPWVRTENTFDAPVFNRAALWAHGNSFYMWGGVAPYATPPSKTLWNFTVFGNGSGTWTRANPANVDMFSSVVRSAGAARAICHNTGLYLGGYVSSASDTWVQGTDGMVPVPGLLTYDLETRVWSNKSAAPGLNSYGTSAYAAATCLEEYGQKGVFLPIGGELMGNPTTYADDGNYQVDLGTLAFYDVGANQWLNQKVSGDAPPQRDRFCTGTARGSNGTLEIYVYGGLQYGGAQHVSNTVYDDVWVLSIPGFVWFKLSVVGTPRAWHECVIVGSQLISVGGMGATLSFQEPDTWTQGLGVLDLSTMTWAESYNPNSTTYESPQVVQDWYRNKAINWTDNDVKALFTNTTSNVTTVSTASPNSTSTPVGPIAGGVVAGVVVILAIFALLWFLRRRKNRRTNMEATGFEDNSKQSSPLSHTLEYQQLSPGELNGAPAVYQLPNDGREIPAELYDDNVGYNQTKDKREIAELDNTNIHGGH